MRGPTKHSIGVAALCTAFAGFVACGGGGSKAPAPTGSPTVVAGSVGATISLTASGANPIEVRIEPTQRVRFINTDTRPHQIQTNPHNLHTDCPPSNVIVLNPGQQVDSGIFNDVKTCGYHDHLLPDTQTYWGTIRVGPSDDAKGPVYSKGW